MAKLETIKIESSNESGFIVINKSDFDSNKHTEFSGEKKVNKPKTITRLRRKKAE